MKVLCDFGVLFFQNIGLLKLLNRFSTGSSDLKFIPIDPEVISYITASCAYKQVIISVENDEEKIYADRLVEFMESCENNVSFASVYKSNLTDEYVKEVVETIISGEASVFEKYKNIANSVFVGNVLKSWWFLFRFSGNKVIKNKYLCGLISMPFLYLIEVFPYVLASCVYMGFFRMNQLSVDLMSIPHFFSSFLYCAFFKAFCELFYLPIEWENQQAMRVTRCSGQFLDGTNHIYIGLFYMVVFLIGVICYSFMNPIGSLLGLFTGITYVISYNFPFLIRLISALFASLVVCVIVKV
jgi:hypothetical protein